jgi:hypothetical protein
MSIAGMILLGRDGFIYLTDVLYMLGWQATDRLALPEKNAEVAIPIPVEEIPKNAIGSPDVEYYGMIPEFPAGRRRSFRRGGGHQWIVRQPIPLHIYPWSWIELEVP